jgi:transposase-like protein
MSKFVTKAIRDPFSKAVIFTDKSEYARALIRRNRSIEIRRQNEEHEAMKKRVENHDMLLRSHGELANQHQDLKTQHQELKAQFAELRDMLSKVAADVKSAHKA